MGGPAHARGRTMAAGPPKGAAEAQKLEVESSRRSVDGTQRYELSSRSKSPMNKLPEPAAAGDAQGAPAPQGQAPARRNADGRAAQAGPPMPGAGPQSQTTPRRNVPIVHPNRSPSPHAKVLPTSTVLSKTAASPRSVPIVHPKRSPSPRKPGADAAAAGNAALTPHGHVEQNRNPNAQAGVGPAKDLRGRMTAAMHRSAGGPPPHVGGGALPGNAPALRNSQPQAHPNAGPGHAGQPQETRQAMPAPHAQSGRRGAHPLPLHPFSCMGLFMPIPARERGQEATERPVAPHSSASSNGSLGDDDFLKELHGHHATNVSESAAAAPSPIRGFDGSCTVIDQVDHSGDWGNLAEGSSTLVHGDEEHDAVRAQRGLTFQEAPAVQPQQMMEALQPRMARRAAVASIA